MLFFLCVFPEFARAERELHYKMYRNLPKANFTLAPIKSDLLDSNAQEIFHQVWLREIAKIKDYKFLTNTDSNAYILNHPFNKIKDSLSIDYLLQSEIKNRDGKFTFFVEWVDLHTHEIKASYQENCRCTLGELLFWGIPDAVEKIRDKLDMKHSRCEENMLRMVTSNIDTSFCIDKYEFPNIQGEAPVVAKTWEEASAICSDHGKRLCTENEWQITCSGLENMSYPYGNTYEATICNTTSQTVELAGNNLSCKSKSGAFDLSGNVYEWTASEWNGKYTDHVVKGGNWNSGIANSTCQARFAEPSGSSSKAIGFRCCTNYDK